MQKTLKGDNKDKKQNEEDLDKFTDDQRLATQQVKRNKLSQVCFEIACSPLFNIVILLLIFIQTYLIADYHYLQSQEEVDVKNQLNIVFCILFTVEILVKFIGFGSKKFAEDKFNIFDAIVVILSLIEMIISIFWKKADAMVIVGLFKALRAIRLLKLAKYNTGMSQLIL